MFVRDRMTANPVTTTEDTLVFDAEADAGNQCPPLASGKKGTSGGNRD